MRAFFVLIMILFLSFAGEMVFSGDVQFVRGDCNADEMIDISDAVYCLGGLFAASGFDTSCADLADTNDDGKVDIADVIYLLNYLFASGPEPAYPFYNLGCDPTDDDLSCLSYKDNISCQDIGSAIIADHTCIDISRVPHEFVENSKTTFRIWYGHTSHGSQIMSGIGMMRDNVFDFNNGAGTLSIVETSGDLGNPDSTQWAVKTKTQLDRVNNDRNLVMWSWCGEVSGRSEQMLQEDYLDRMNALEQEYPGVTFVYMTGHLDGSGEDGNLNIRNEQIRVFCRENNKILFDFADIESYDPDGNYYLDLFATDACNYKDPDSGATMNWADEWCAANPGECLSCGSCAHSKCLNCQMKGRVFWWMMARIAGWDGN